MAHQSAAFLSLWIDEDDAKGDPARCWAVWNVRLPGDAPRSRWRFFNEHLDPAKLGWVEPTHLTFQELHGWPSAEVNDGGPFRPDPMCEKEPGESEREFAKRQARAASAQLPLALALFALHYSARFGALPRADGPVGARWLATGLMVDDKRLPLQLWEVDQDVGCLVEKGFAAAMQQLEAYPDESAVEVALLAPATKLKHLCETDFDRLQAKLRSPPPGCPPPEPFPELGFHDNYHGDKKALEVTLRDATTGRQRRARVVFERVSDFRQAAVLCWGEQQVARWEQSMAPHPPAPPEQPTRPALATVLGAVTVVLLVLAGGLALYRPEPVAEQPAPRAVVPIQLTAPEPTPPEPPAPEPAPPPKPPSAAPRPPTSWGCDELLPEASTSWSCRVRSAEPRGGHATCDQLCGALLDMSRGKGVKSEDLYAMGDVATQRWQLMSDPLVVVGDCDPALGDCRYRYPNLAATVEVPDERDVSCPSSTFSSPTHASGASRTRLVASLASCRLSRR